MEDDAVPGRGRDQVDGDGAPGMQADAGAADRCPQGPLRRLCREEGLSSEKGLGSEKGFGAAARPVMSAGQLG